MMKKLLVPGVLTLLLGSCQPASQTQNSSLPATERSDSVKQVSAPAEEKKTGSEKVSYEKSFTAPNGIQFNITTLGTDSVRQMQIIAVKDGIFLTDIMEEITGELIIVRITDLNQNKQPELLIFTETRDKHEYWHFYAYEFAEKDWKKVYFPQLTAEQALGYKGQDVYRLIDKDRLRRTFPVFRDGEKQAAGGEKRVIEYMLNEKGEMYIDTVRTE